jgi:hypothetical protein
MLDGYLDVAMTTGHTKIKIAWIDFAYPQPFKDRTRKSTS